MHRESARLRAGVVSADERALPAAVARLARPVERGLRAGVAGIEAAAFWIAALFPVAYLPLLAALQHAVLDPAVVLGSGGANLLALLIGHRHSPGRFDRDTAADPTSD